MKLKSLGYRTEMIFARFDGEITDRGDYLVIVTPPNPGYYWGNYILFSKAPGKADFEQWQEVFAREIGHRPGIEHVSLGWDSPEGELGASNTFLDNGFSLENCIVMTCTETVPPARPDHDMTYAPVIEDRHWQQGINLQMIDPPSFCTLEEHRRYMTRRVDRFRAMMQADVGSWFGAFDGDRLVAQMGLYCDNNLARFQDVATHPDYRRRGICSTLLQHAANWAKTERRVEQLVIMVDPDFDALRIYETAGFKAVERQVGVAKAPPKGV